MGLEAGDWKELESLINAAAHDAEVPTGLARRMMQTRGNVEDFGMVMGNFIAQFQIRIAGNQKWGTVDTLSIMMARIAHLRESLIKQFYLR